MPLFARYNGVVQDEDGNAIPLATIEVVREIDSTLAALYSDRDGLVPLGNPFTGNADGTFFFHADGGAYRITATKDSFSVTRRYEPVGTAGEKDVEGEITSPPSFIVDPSEPSTDFVAGSIWIDSDSAEIDMYELSGSPLDWVDTGVNLRGAHGVDGTSLFTRVRVVDVSPDSPGTRYENGDTIDGVVLATNDLVLRAYTTPDATNGVYVVPASGPASRLAAFDTYDEHPGVLFSVMEGTTYADTLWLCTSNQGGTINSTALAIIQLSAGETLYGLIRIATNAQIWAATVGALAITAAKIEEASALVTLTEAENSPSSFDWDAGVNRSWTVSAARMLPNPINGQPGTSRTVLIQGNSSTDRVITFDTQYLGEVPTITDCDDTRWYLVTIFCVTASHFVASAKRAKG